MYAHERMSLAAVAIGASICDRKLDDKERQVVNGILNDLGLSEEERGLVYRRVFFSPPAPDSLIRDIDSGQIARRARDLARKVCEADGVVRSEEVAFLKGLEEEAENPTSASEGLHSVSSQSTEYIIQQFARLSEAIRNRSPVVGTIFLTSSRAQLVLNLRRTYRAGKSIQLNEARILVRLMALSLTMRPYGLAIAHSDNPFHGKANELSQRVNEGFTDYLVTYALGCLLQEYYENPEALSARELRGVYVAAMLRGRFTRESKTVSLAPSPLQH